MTPKRFKAVCTETGREFGAHEINRHIISLPSHDAQWFSWDQITVYEDIEDFISKYNPELCQSTGLTDTKGQEVYEGDIILVYFQRTDSGYVYSVFFDRGGFKLEGFYFPTQERPGGQRHWLGIEVLLDAIEDGARLYCVGNKWQPDAELQARAEAVSNGKS